MIVEEAVRVIRFMATTGAVPPLLALLTASAAVTWWVRRTGRSQRPALLLFAAIASLALIVVMTLLRETVLLMAAVAAGEVRPPAPTGLLDWSDDGWRRISYDPFSIQVLLNVALFAPAGATWTLMTARPLRVLAGLLGLTFVVEGLQAVTGLGANDVADLLANGAGAGLGVLVGTLTWWLWPRASARPRPRGREMALATAAVTALGLVATVGLHVGAQHRQRALEAELQGRFTGSTLEQYRAWETDERIVDAWFHAASVPADGVEHLDDAARVRWPASFLGVRRCVLVEWTSGGAEIQRAAGRRCSDLLT